MKDKLNSILTDLQSKYGNEFVLGIFAYTKDKEFHYEAVIIPKFDNVCLNKPLILEINDGILIRDIRLIQDVGCDVIFSEHRIISARYSHIFDNLLYKSKEKIKKDLASNGTATEFSVFIIKILRLAWCNASAAIRFCKQLTEAEKTALVGIVNAIGEEGYFSQEKVAQATGISRLSMTRLVEKIKQSGVAEVEYHGVKGTWMRFIDDTVMDIRG